MMRKNKNSIQPVDTRVFSYWTAMYKAFYSNRLYVDVAKRWKGIGFIYLLLVSSLLTIPITIPIVQSYNRYYDENIIAPIQLIPPLQIENGAIHVDKPMPYLIKDSTGEVVMMLDTSGRTTQFPSEYPKMRLLITNNALWHRPPNMELFFGAKKPSKPEAVYKTEISPDSSGYFDANTWLEQSYIPYIKWGTDLMFYPMITLVFFTIHWIFSLALASIGRIFISVFFNFRLNWKQSCRVMVVAMTPQMLLLTLGILFDTKLPFGGSGGLILIAVYYYYAALCINRESKSVVVS